VLADRAVAGFTVDEARLAESLEKNPILATALTPLIGYDRAAKIAKIAAAEGRRVREVAVAESGLTAEELDRLLNPRNLTQGG
jgi:fumarate hydratase class II